VSHYNDQGTTPILCEDVSLDGSEVGQTPLRLEKIKEGTHKLQIKDREKEIYVKEGLFKGKRNRPQPLGGIR